jgi:DNA modification methylase
MNNYQILHGDCKETLKTLPDNSVDSIVTDPPYELGFMNKSWDKSGVANSIELWTECLRVLKPGGHLLAFSGTRTYHRMTCSIEDAGFEIRDQIQWVYGSGFPKSRDISKAIDRKAGAEREVVGRKENSFGRKPGGGDGWDETIEGGEASDHIFNITAPATSEAKKWQGWGTALKPANEPICVARKPFKGTVAENVLEHGAGALNIDGCRVESYEDLSRPFGNADGGHMQQLKTIPRGTMSIPNPAGRWPANFIHDGSDEVLALFPVTGASKATPRNNGEFKSVAKGRDLPHVTYGYDDNGGSAARFFYCAKSSKKDRNEGLDRFEEKQASGMPMRSADGNRGGEGIDGSKTDRLTKSKNFHPTVKPTNLMRYLCRLVTPPGGTVLDPFMGSGSTGKAAMLEGFNFIGCELSEEYISIAKARIEHARGPATTGFSESVIGDNDPSPRQLSLF